MGQGRRVPKNTRAGSSPANPDPGDHTASGFAVAAEGVVLAGVASGASTSDGNVSFKNARRSQLPGVDAREVQADVTRDHAELGGNLRADFVAARSDRRTDGSMEVFGSGTELVSHGPDRGLHNGCDRTTPTGVNGGDAAMDGVGQQDRHAVGGLNSDSNARCVLDESIGIFLAMQFAAVGDDASRVNLMNGNCAERGGGVTSTEGVLDESKGT